MKEIEIRTHINGIDKGTVALGGKDVPIGEIGTIGVKVQEDCPVPEMSQPRGIILNGLHATVVFADGSVWFVHRPTDKTQVFERVGIAHMIPHPGRPELLLHALPTESVRSNRLSSESVQGAEGASLHVMVGRGQTA